MRKFLLVLSVVFTGVLGFMIWNGSSAKDNFSRKYIHDDLFRIEIPVEKPKAIPLLDALNAKNSQLKRFQCNDLFVRAYKERNVKLRGEIAYEKDKKFRLNLRSLVGPELDVGSDGAQFWFWSKRMPNPALYWAKYEDLSKTRLKTPFNPYWLASTLGIDVIDYKDAQVDQYGKLWRVIKKTVNAQNQPITVAILIDVEKVTIVGHTMYNDLGKLVASSEIQEFTKCGNYYLPAKITYMWYEEGVQVNWYLNSVVANAPIPSSRFTMPARTPKIEMSRDHFGLELESRSSCWVP